MIGSILHNYNSIILMTVASLTSHEGCGLRDYGSSYVEQSVLKTSFSKQSWCLQLNQFPVLLLCMPSKNCCTDTSCLLEFFGFLEDVRLLPSRLLLVCPPQAGPRSQPTNYPCPDLCTLHWEIIITLHVAKYSSTLHLPPVDMVFSIGLCTSICMSASKKGHLPLPLLMFRMPT